MASNDQYFVPTRSSLTRRISHKVVSFQEFKSDEKIKNEKRTPSEKLAEVIDMKKARFEVYKFAKNALRGEDKQKSKIELAIKLGAKKPKNTYQNYRTLKEEKKKQLEEAEQKKALYNIVTKHKISEHRSKFNKGSLRRKRKIGSGILNTYGEVTGKKHRK